jgi:hypothetical protein
VPVKIDIAHIMNKWCGLHYIWGFSLNESQDRVDQSQLQPLKKSKKKPFPKHVSGYSLESRVTQNTPTEASTFRQKQEIILSGYFLRMTVEKRTEVSWDQRQNAVVDAL